ncbi:solute carrier family 22 member 6-B-like [Cinclus cinclus]|uniref:solute carrier family 22 member 6-B-like n=1 Tax=Cinclus cinclus TaxID=127875 RepID=UPI002E0F5BB4
MAFSSLLEHVGGMGRFQVLSVLLLSLPVLMMASHNLLQNFTAATSDHRCRPRPEANATGLDPEALLRVWVPHGERCQRFVTPQWWLLEANGSVSNSSGLETEPCGDGWVYDRSVFTSTIITENFEFNIYIIQLIFGAVDIPAKLVSILTITYVGRRFTQAFALILAGLAILANTLVPRDLRTLRTALAVFGKGCLAASFNCVFLYTGELYPTVIRQTGMGLANTMSRLGSIMAPLVKMAGELFPALPFIIYGAAPVVSGLVAAFLPETRNVALPETVEEPDPSRPKGKYGKQLDTAASAPRDPPVPPPPRPELPGMDNVRRE